MAKAKPLSIDLLVTDADTQSRISINDDAVEEYAELITSSESWPFPPLDVFHDGNQYLVADGFHRVAASARAKRSSVPCKVHKGTAKDARIFAMTANDRHGLRMTRADKRACVEWLLDNGGRMSQKAIAEAAGVSPRTVKYIVADRKPYSLQGKVQFAHDPTISGDSDDQWNAASTDTPASTVPASGEAADSKLWDAAMSASYVLEGRKDQYEINASVAYSLLKNGKVFLDSRRKLSEELELRHLYELDKHHGLTATHEQGSGATPASNCADVAPSADTGARKSAQTSEDVGGDARAPYLVTGDHPINRRVDERFYSLDRAHDFAESLKADGFENVKVVHDTPDDHPDYGTCPTCKQRLQEPLPEKTVKEGTKARPGCVEVVRAYCIERENSVDPEAFFDFYEANGWKQGKGKAIKDWQAAVRTWEKNGQRTNGTNAVQESMVKSAQALGLG